MSNKLLHKRFPYASRTTFFCITARAAVISPKRVLTCNGNKSLLNMSAIVTFMFDVLDIEVPVPSPDGGRHVSVGAMYNAVQSIVGDPTAKSGTFLIEDPETYRKLYPDEPGMLVDSSKLLRITNYHDIGPFVKYAFEQSEGLRARTITFKIKDFAEGMPFLPLGPRIPTDRYPSTITVQALTGKETTDVVLVNALDIWDAIGSVPVIILHDSTEVLPEDTYIMINRDAVRDESRYMPILRIMYNSEHNPEAVESVRRYARRKHWLRAVDHAATSQWGRSVLSASVPGAPARAASSRRLPVRSHPKVLPHD